MDEKEVLIKRLYDLARKRDEGNYIMFSPFLSPDILPDAGSIGNICFSGGYEDAERVVIAFLPDYLTEQDVDWPISVIKISPTDGKIYNHRDYLGSLMALGIKRQVLGDIIVNGETAYLFCLNSIEEYILNNLTHISGAVCKTERLSDVSLIPERRFEEIKGTAASERLDCMVALAIKTSRTKAAEFITSGNVMVNHKEIQKVTYIMKEGDRFSVRGKGKFIYDGKQGDTKKGRTIAAIRKYI